MEKKRIIMRTSRKVGLGEMTDKQAGHVDLIDTSKSITGNERSLDHYNFHESTGKPQSVSHDMSHDRRHGQVNFEGCINETECATIVTMDQYPQQAVQERVQGERNPESSYSTEFGDSKNNLLRSNLSSNCVQTFSSLKQLVTMTSSHVLPTNHRRDKTLQKWTSLCWVFLMVSWQVSLCQGRPSTQELMHMEARLDIIEKLESQSSQGVDQNALYQPEGRDRADWLSCHGQPCDTWNKVQRILTELHLIDLNVKPSSVQNDAPLSNLFLDLISGPALESAAGNNELTRPWEGTDILLTLEDAEEVYMEVLHKVLGGKRRRKRKINRDNNKRWDLPIVYKMDGSHHSHEEGMILRAIKMWEAETCVRFKKVDHRDRIEENHLIFTKGQYSCASYVGKMNFGKYNPQPVNLGSSCFEKLGVPVHEIGHALGLWHEHQRPIRNEHIVVDSSNIFFWAYNNFMAGSTTHVQDYGVPYDYNSVMHYGATIGSRNGRPTLRPINSQFLMNMGQREELSFLDTKVVNKAYCHDTCGTSQTKAPCQNGGYQDPNNCDLCKCPDGLSGDNCTQVASSKQAQCGGKHTLSRHGEQLHLETPGHTSGAYYVFGTECFWLIETEPKNRLTLTFEGRFNLMCEFETCSHWVEVKTKQDLSENGPRFCCSQTPTATLVSDTGKMLVIFKSIAEPKYENYIGFRAVVTLVTNEVVRPEENQNGGPQRPGHMTGIHGNTGQGIEPTPVISTTNFPSTESPDTGSRHSVSPEDTISLTDRDEADATTETKEPRKKTVSRNQTTRKKKKKQRKSAVRKKQTSTGTEMSTTTEMVPITEYGTSSKPVVTGTWYIESSTAFRRWNKKILTPIEIPDTSSWQIETSESSSVPSYTDTDRASRVQRGREKASSEGMDHATVIENNKYSTTLRMEESDSTEKKVTASPKLKHSSQSRKKHTSTAETGLKPRKNKQRSSKERQTPVETVIEDTADKQVLMTTAKPIKSRQHSEPLIASQNQPGPDRTGHNQVGPVRRRQQGQRPRITVPNKNMEHKRGTVSTPMAPSYSKTTYGIRPVTIDEQTAHTTEAPVTDYHNNGNVKKQPENSKNSKTTYGIRPVTIDEQTVHTTEAPVTDYHKNGNVKKQPGNSKNSKTTYGIQPVIIDEQTAHTTEAPVTDYHKNGNVKKRPGNSKNSKTTYGIRPVIIEEQGVHTTETPVTDYHNNGNVKRPGNSKNKIRSKAKQSSTPDLVVYTEQEEEGSSYTELSSATTEEMDTESPTKVQTTPKRAPPKRTYWRTKKPNMKLVIAARRRAARRRAEQQNKIHEDVDKRQETMELASTEEPRQVEKSDRKIRKNIQTDNENNAKTVREQTRPNSNTNRLVRKDSKTHHTKDTVIYSSTEHVIPHRLTLTTFDISSIPTTATVARIRPTRKPSIEQTKPGIVPTKLNTAKSNTIDSTESNDSATDTSLEEGETVTGKHPTHSTHRPITVPSTEKSTTWQTTSESTVSETPSTTTSSQTPTTVQTATIASTEKTTTVTQHPIVPSVRPTEASEKWTDWSTCLGMDCKCGGCSWRIRYRLCDNAPCQGQEMRSERKPCDRICGKEDTERFWVARFYTRYTYFRVKRQCSECCGGFERRGDKCVLTE